MQTIYGELPFSQIEQQKRYLYGSIIDLLYRFEDDYPLLDQRIQTLINQLTGSIKLFNNDARVLSIVAWLETARNDKTQFRKCILDAANMVDELGGNPNV